MNKYDFIGQVKFYDYRVNHFGYLTVYNPTDFLKSDSLRMTEDSLIDEPNLYYDNSLILFNIDSDTKIPKDVVLIESLIEKNELIEVQNVIIKTLENIDFDKLESFASRFNIDIQNKIKNIFEVLSKMKIDNDEIKKYYKLIEKYYPIDECLLFFFNNDKNHFKKIILSVPDHISNLSDHQRILYITKTKNIKIIDTLLKDWKFGHIATTIELIKYLTNNKIESSVINGFIEQLKNNINDFSLTQQFDLANYLNDKELEIKAINGWSFPSENETIVLLNKIVEKEIDSSKIKTFTKELDARFNSFNNPLQIAIINYLDDIDFFLNKIFSTENKIANDNFDFTLDWIEERAPLFIEKKTIGKRLKKEILNFFKDSDSVYLKDFCGRDSFSWLLKDKEILELWSFENIYDLESFTTFFFNSNISELSTEMDEKITSILLDKVNDKSFELATQWHEKLTDKLILMNMLYNFSIDKANYQRALYGEKYLTLNTDNVCEVIESYTGNDIKYKGLISFWDVIMCALQVANLELPDKPLMISWFQRDDIPEPLQLIFLKALIACSDSINPAGIGKLDIANYINEFPFTDLSASLLMILIKNRKTTGIKEVAPQLNDAFYKSLTQTDENPYIGYSMKHCSKRKYYAGDIHYDSNKKTYSYNGAFYLEESYDSPDQYSLEFNEYSSSSNEEVY